MAQVGLLEDNARISRLCATMLKYAGHHVIVYEHPQVCLDALLPPSKNSEALVLAPIPPLDVLIVDLHLPDIPGLEVVRFLCSHPSTQTLPLILCTAGTSYEIEQALRIAPHASFIEKPFTFQNLISSINDAVAGSGD